MVVLTTVAEKKDAEALAEAVLQARLAACVQIGGPIDSRYWWNGRIESSAEFVCSIKTRRSLYDRVEKLLLERHPYDTPQIIALAALEISPAYWQWLREQVAAE